MPEKINKTEAEWRAELTPEEYERRRAEYIRAGKGQAPPGATPLPSEESRATDEHR